MKTNIRQVVQPDENVMLRGEWLATNGIGGYSSSSVSKTLTRRYHGLLVAALHIPFGRTVMLNYIQESILLSNNTEHCLSSLKENPQDITKSPYLVEFKLEDGIPAWLYQINTCTFEKTLHLINRQNTLHVTYKYLSGEEPITLKLRPFIQFRHYEHSVNTTQSDQHYHLHAHNGRYEIECQPFPSLRLASNQCMEFTLDQYSTTVFYELEAARGYECYGDLLSLGFFVVQLYPGQEITFIASTEEWETIDALTPQQAWQAEKIRKKNLLNTAETILQSSPTEHQSSLSKLILAADQFIFTPASRYQDMIRLQAAGEESASIIAGFPWFTDWGRDTMISLEGLTLLTGRSKLAYSILQTFAYYIKDGLIPNMFPDSEKEARYNTADATLWFFHAAERYMEISQDRDILELLLPKFAAIIDYHIKGTHFGIKMAEDGLLMQGEQGYQLTWMDAKVADWVVTPRRGKAVEINALWYNALKLMEQWTGEKSELAAQCYESFNKKFWIASEKYLYDVVDAESQNSDNALRPNQIFAISLKYPVLNSVHWEDVIQTIKRELLTPVGLRTLAPSHPEFKSSYDGDLRSRDAAYHQGTVWPWLLGPFIDAWLKVYPHDLHSVSGFIKGLEEHLNVNCMGTIGEIFDACEPYHARGCFAQAWSVAELIRCIAKLKHRP